MLRSASPRACGDTRVPLLCTPLLSSPRCSLAGRDGTRSAPGREVVAPDSVRQVQKAGAGGVSRWPRRLLGLCLAALPSLEKSDSGTSHPSVPLRLPGVQEQALARALLSPRPRSPACPPALPRSGPRPARPSSLSLRSDRAGRVAKGQGPGRRESGTRDARAGGARAAAETGQTHRKNSGEEGLSLVEPASLKPELASFSHLTL